MDVAKLDPRGRKVKILATVGPASRSPEMLEKLYRAGVDAFRVNMSHGDHAVHAETITAIRALERKVNRPITVLCDLQGPKLRVGKFKDGRAVIRHSGHFTLDHDPKPGDENRVQLPHPELFGVLQKGQRLMDLIQLTRSLGQKLSDDPETYRWQDPSDAAGTVVLKGGRVTEWTFTRPPETPGEAAPGTGT